LILDASVLPTTVELLSLTEESIGVAHYLAACWILYDDPCLTSRLPYLTELAATCARAIRLANDLRTWAREEQEGMVNLVVVEAAAIGRRDPALTAEECRTRARQALATALAAEVAHLRAGQAASPAPAGAPELGLVRLAQVVTGTYATRDYHRVRGV
ncbi:MAG: terpene synthase family protein, partial [Thermomicrobiales bacterium]